MLAAYGGAALLPWWSGIPPWGAGLLTLLVVAAGAAWVRTAVLRRGARAVVGLHRSPEGQWWLRTAAGGEFEVALAPERLVHPRLVVLVARPLAGGRAYPVVIPAGALAADDFRRLRATLRAEG